MFSQSYQSSVGVQPLAAKTPSSSCQLNVAFLGHAGLFSAAESLGLIMNSVYVVLFTSSKRELHLVCIVSCSVDCLKKTSQGKQHSSTCSLSDPDTALETKYFKMDQDIKNSCAKLWHAAAKNEGVLRQKRFLTLIYLLSWVVPPHVLRWWYQPTLLKEGSGPDRTITLWLSVKSVLNKVLDCWTSTW